MYFFVLFFLLISIPNHSDTVPGIQSPWQDDYQTAINSIRDKNYKLAIMILADLSKNTGAANGLEGIYYHLGLSYYGLGKFSEAQKSFEMVLKKESGSAFYARSMFWRGEIFRGKKQYDSALKDLIEFTGKFPKDDYSISAYDSIAEIYKDMGQDDDEIATYLEAIEKYPNHERTPFLHFRYGRRLYEKNRFKPSIKVFKDIILNSRMKSYETADLTSDSEIFIGRNLIGLGEYKNAQKQFSDIIQKYSGDEDKSAALYFSGAAYLLVKDEKLALEKWNEIRRKYPKTEWAIESYLSESLHYKHLKKYDDAILVLKNYLEKNPKSFRWEDFYSEIGYLYKRKGEIPSSIDSFNQILTSDNEKKVSFALFSLAEIEESASSYDKALEHYEKVWNKFRETDHAPHALYGIAKIRHKKKEYALCIQSVDTLAEKYPDYVNREYAFLLKADSLSASEKYPESLAIYNSLKNSKDSDVRFQSEMGIGWVYSDKKMYARAEGVFLKVLQDIKSQEKYFREVNHALGLIRFNLKLYSKAKENFKTILYESKMDANDQLKRDSVYRLALVEFRTGNFPETLALLKKAISLKYENQAEAFYYKGLTEKKLELINDSIMSFTESIRLSTDAEKNFKAGSLYQRGLNYLAIGKKEEGILDLRESSSLQEEASDDSQFELGKLYLKTNPEKSIAEFEVLKEKFPNSPYILEFYFLLADHYRSQNKYDEALKIYKVVEKDFEQSKKSDAALLLLADGYFRKEDFKSARKTCEKYLKIYSDYEGADDCLFKIADVVEREESTEKKIEYLKKNKSAFQEKKKFDYIIKLSESLLRIGNYKEAGNLLKLVPEKDKVAYKKHYLQGQILDIRNDSASAYPHFLFVDLHSEGELAAKSLLRLGRYDLIQKKYESAIKRYSKIIYQYSAFREEYSESLYFIIVAYERLGLKDDAEKYKTKLKAEAQNTKFVDLAPLGSAEEIPFR